MIGSMSSDKCSEEDEEKYRIVAFVCENDAVPALDMAGLQKLKYSADIRFIRCVVWDRQHDLDCGCNVKRNTVYCLSAANTAMTTSATC